MAQSTPLVLKPGTAWADAGRRALAAAPEAFREDRVLNLWAGDWQSDGQALPATSPVAGHPIAGPPRLDAGTATKAVRAALDQHHHRPRRPHQHRDLLALLLMWEIGKPWRLACADVDRAIEGVRW